MPVSNPLDSARTALATGDETAFAEAIAQIADEEDNQRAQGRRSHRQLDFTSQAIQGAVTLDFRHIGLPIAFHRCTFAPGTKLTIRRAPAALRLSRIAWSGRVDLVFEDSAKSPSRVSLESLEQQGGTMGLTGFHGTLAAVHDLNFESLILSGCTMTLEAQAAKWQCNLLCEHSSFPSTLAFRGSRPSDVTFTGCTFSSGLHFSETPEWRGNLSLFSCKVSQAFSITGVKLIGTLNIAPSKMGAAPHFDRIVFDNTTIEGGISVIESTTTTSPREDNLPNLLLSNTIVKGPLSVSLTGAGATAHVTALEVHGDSRFKLKGFKTASFNELKCKHFFVTGSTLTKELAIGGKADLVDASKVRADSLTFADTQVSKVLLDFSLVTKGIYFRKCKDLREVESQEGTFGELLFHNSRILDKASFVACVFSGVPTIEGDTLPPNTSFHLSRFSNRNSDQSEASYRTIKREMEKAHNSVEEARFAAYELDSRTKKLISVSKLRSLARQGQMGQLLETLLEWVVSASYRGLNYFGFRFMWPLYWWIAAVLAGTLLYGQPDNLLLHGDHLVEGTWMDQIRNDEKVLCFISTRGLTFSTLQAFFPLKIFAGNFDLYPRHGSILLLSILHSAFSTVCLFLWVSGLRRPFRTLN